MSKSNPSTTPRRTAMVCDEVAGSDSSDSLFSGVRFVLIGFDSVSESQYRAVLERRGAVDVGKYDQSCTHVIVSGRVYDDPVCVAARTDGKTLVTELWIEDSVDFASQADASRVLYRPVMDFKGVPGSDKLCICLTGYQRRERDDIMKMVELLGAHFSKPLVATKITHLICYKFEGEKYELAKKVNIKLVNHRWLEDCLKAWQILPVDEYTKSGWELEMEEAEAKDSEEETDDVGMARVSSPQNNMQKTRNLGLSMQKSASKISAGFLSTNDKIIFQNMEGLRNERSPQTSGNSLAIAHPSISVVDIKNENRPSPDARVLSGSVPSDVPLENVTPNRSFERKVPSQSTESTIKNISFENSPGNVGQHCKDVVSVNQQRQSSIKAFDAPSSELHFNKSVESNKQLPQKRKTEINKKMSSSPNSEHSPLMNPKSLRSSTTLATSIDDIQYSPKLANEESPFSRLTSKILPEKHGVDSLTPVSSSYKRRHLENKQLLFGVQNSKNTLLTDQFVREDQIGKEVNACANTSANLFPLGAKLSTLSKPSIATQLMNNPCNAKGNDVSNTKNTNSTTCISSKCEDKVTEIDNATLLMNTLDNAKGGNASNTESITCISRKYKDKVTKIDISPLPSTTENNLSMSHDDLVKCEKEILKVQDIQNGNSKIQEIVVEQESTMLEKEMTNPGSMGREGNGNLCAGKIEMVPDKVKKKATVKKLGNRLKAAGKSGFNSRKKTTENQSSLDSEKTAESEHVVNTNALVSADPIPDQVVLAANKAEASTRSICKSSRKMSKVNAIYECTNPGKENLPIDDGHLHTNSICSTKITNKDGDYLHRKNDEMFGMCHRDASEINRTITTFEPVCFLLSGHRLQRKEFRQVIRRLRGRVCRDTHQWSYQATHFIVPDPVRRTEKFFAATAAGRWILKTDYLTASNEACRFLEEEPFEWHNNGLTEDGAINLAAPRKWRKLRERTGHGALYGMRIIIYGDCIMPSLDTLKRVVKAGDGTILATSPPYTRFLSSGVDFAIISPGMPHVDVWIQEFVRHEIPCVLIDYLVEYVCKPGYPLEQHVLFNTQSFAEKSFANLQKRLEEVVCHDSTMSEVDDLPCVVCGSQDRVEVMLICGNEAGTAGCGIGTHIDCCDPPLDAVPVGDWFCCRCSKCKPMSEIVKTKKKPMLKKLR